MSPERKTILLLCLAAALRVFVFSAAFPFFNNVDEDAHFDLTLRYAHGDLPRGLTPFSPETAEFIALFGSPEYRMKAEEFPDGKIPAPLWTLAPEEIEQLLPHEIAQGRALTNHEASTAPLYYAVTGVWLQAGKLLGLGGGFLLYWIRFLNVPLVAALVWLGYLAARLVFPDRSWLRIGVAALLAFFPQNMFYSIQSDVFSPLCYGAAFIFLLRWLHADGVDRRAAVFAGLGLAAAWLVKSSNLPLVAVAAAVVLWKTWRVAREQKLHPALSALTLLFVCAAVPIGSWMLWSKHVFGDLTGSRLKIEFMGWTRKPFVDWWHHPLFSPHGLWTFTHDLLARFWRGEFIWHGKPLASAAMNLFYVVITVILIGIAAVSTARKSSGLSAAQRQALAFSFWNFAAAIGFLAVMSIMFDFGNNSFVPSPQYPYFTAGRLMAGALIPFSLLFVHGFDRALAFMRSDGGRLAALGAFLLLITISEVLVNRPVFASEYNWFHFWGR